MKDETIAEQLLEGDPSAIAVARGWIRAAFHPYRNRFREDREDIEQDVLLQLIESLREGRFRGRSSFATYLKSFVHHKAIDMVRVARRRQWVDVDDLDLRDQHASALEQLSRSEQVVASLRALQEAPEACRELWRLLQEGLGYDEMSRHLGIAAGTIRVRVLRCRRKAVELRQKFLEKV